MLDQSSFEREQRQWLTEQFEAIPDELSVLRPSEWAEQRRYLPPNLTPMPGYYRFDVAPYLREIIDCFSPDSPIRRVSVMKGAQIGATVGVLENAIGYAIDHVRTAPVMWVTADAELALARLGSNVIPMIQHSGLESLIQSADAQNARKTGKTDKKVEWEGGGYLLPFGAQNANKLRTFSIEWLLNDEIDGWPGTVGKDGDPLKLVLARTAAYESSRKILDISTPLLKGQSKIAELFKAGDQRRYFVCCLRCNYPQVLRWKHISDDGVVAGIVWETEGGHVVPDSARYVCQACGHAHANDDKTRLLSPDNGAEWRPTAEPSDPHHRSYHVSALYSPVGMQTWGALAQQWHEAWDDERNRMRDSGKLQTFYNNGLGEPFEARGERVRFSAVSAHRRHEYMFGQVPNGMAQEYCGSPVLLLICTVDVHAHSLPVAVHGWCRDRRPVLIDYWRFEGDTAQLDDPGTWGRLRELIEQKEYVADDGKRYRVAFTLIDSGYLTDQVYRFCAEYDAGVAPVKGRDMPPRSAAIKEFAEFPTPNGVRAYGVTVDLYKDRWSASLRREWSGQGLQPVGHFNAPADISDQQLRELTVEFKAPKAGEGFEWKRPSGAANELWDLLIYSNAGLDLLAWDYCRNQLELDTVDLGAFCEMCQQQQAFFLAA